MDLEMIGADSSKKVWWTVAAGSAQQPSASEIMTGTGLCDGSVSQAATYSAYIQCGLVHDSTYVVYIYFGDSTDGGTVFISFESNFLLSKFNFPICENVFYGILKKHI